MKKIFTLVMLSIFVVMTANAEEETLWEGDVFVSWEDPAPAGSVKEWGSDESGKDISAYVVAGEKINFYFKAEATSTYHAYKFDDWDWNSLPGQDQVDFGGDITVTLEIDDAIAAAVAAKGLRVHGHGFHVVKVTKGEIDGGGETIPDIDAALLWQGEQEIDAWGTDPTKVMVLTEESEGFNVFVEKLTTACNLYFLMENATGCDFRIAGQWGDWAATGYPADGYNHMQALDEDNVVKVGLTEEFVTKAFVEKGGIAFWGNGGFKIKAIGTTKDSVTGATDGVRSIEERGERSEERDYFFNLAGQKVGKDYKGIVIINGKKVIK